MGQALLARAGQDGGVADVRFALAAEEGLAHGFRRSACVQRMLFQLVARALLRRDGE